MAAGDPAAGGSRPPRRQTTLVGASRAPRSASPSSVKRPSPPPMRAVRSGATALRHSSGPAGIVLGTRLSPAWCTRPRAQGARMQIAATGNVVGRRGEPPGGLLLACGRLSQPQPTTWDAEEGGLHKYHSAAADGFQRPVRRSRASNLPIADGKESEDILGSAAHRTPTGREDKSLPSTPRVGSRRSHPGSARPA
jgi:hypothetical protein